MSESACTHPSRYKLTAGDLGSIFKVFLVIVMPLIITIMGATWRVSQIMGEYTTGLHDINARVDQASARIDAFESDRYTLTMASERALRMAISNPGMIVHDPRDPSKTIRVDTSKYTPITGPSRSTP